MTDSLSFIKLLEKTKLDKVIFRYQNSIPNAQLNIELVELVLKSAVMKIQKVFFKQYLGIVMGTNLLPILANIYGYAEGAINNNL